MDKFVTLVGGPLDGGQEDVSALTDDEIADGLALIAAGCAYPGGRSIYAPREGDPGRLHWSYDSP